MADTAHLDTQALQVLLDKQAIYEVLIRYCRGADRGDADLIAAHDGQTLALTNGCVCCSIADDLGGAAFVPPVAIGMEEADRDRLRAGIAAGAAAAGQRRLVIVAGLRCAHLAGSLRRGPAPEPMAGRSSRGRKIKPERHTCTSVRTRPQPCPPGNPPAAPLTASR